MRFQEAGTSSRAASTGSTTDIIDFENDISESHEVLVYVVDPRRIIRECLARCLELAFGKGAVEAFPSLADWQQNAREASPISLVLLCGDVHAAEPLADAPLPKPRRNGGMPRMVVLSDREGAGDILRALESGAQGYIPTSVALDVAVEALRLVQVGGMFIPASSLTTARRALETASPGDRLRACGLFTERQAAVVQALREGKANKIIAHELGMQESTVKVHVRNIMKKLNARNRTEVAYLTNHLFERGGQ